MNSETENLLCAWDFCNYKHNSKYEITRHDPGKYSLLSAYLKQTPLHFAHTGEISSYRQIFIILSIISVQHTQKYICNATETQNKQTFTFPLKIFE